jgi:hypothetical protein
MKRIEYQSKGNWYQIKTDDGKFYQFIILEIMPYFSLKFDIFL